HGGHECGSGDGKFRGSRGAPLRGRALRERAVGAAGRGRERQCERCPGDQRRVRAVRGQPYRRWLRRGGVQSAATPRSGVLPEAQRLPPPRALRHPRERPGRSRRVDRPAVRSRRPGRHAAGGHGQCAAGLARRLTARLRRSRQRARQGPTDHLPRGHRSDGPSQGRGHPGVPRAVRWRSGLRAVAAAVPGQEHGRFAARGERDPQHLGGHDQRACGHARRAAHARGPHCLASEGRHPMTVTWRSVSTTLRTLARWVTIVQLVGYTTSLIFVWHTTRLVPPGVAARYRGVDPEATQAAMQFPKSFAEMLTITHTHLLSMAVIFVLTGLGVALCERVSERWKRWLIAEPFVALLVSFSAMWLMRYVDPRFSWLLEASSALLAVTFYVQSYLILREVRRAEGVLT